MLELPSTVTIFNVARGMKVRAQLVRLTREQAAKQIDGTWWAIGVSKTVHSEEDDHHWSWRKLVGELRNNLAWDAYAIQSASGNVEGAMTADGMIDFELPKNKAELWLRQAGYL